MALDPNIIGGIRPMQLESPVNALAQALRVQGMQQDAQLGQAKLDEYQRGKARQNKLLELVQGLPGNATDEQRIQAMRGGGYFDEADKLETGMLARQKTGAEVQAKEWETQSKKLDIAGQAFGFVRKNPTLEAAHQALDYLGANGIYTPETVAQYKQSLAADPTKIASLADMAFRTVLDAKDQLSKVETRDLGGSTQTLGIDPVTGKTTVLNTAKNTQSPDSAASVAVQMRGQNMADARAREMAQLTREGQQTQVVTDPNQGVLLVNKATKTAVPASFADGSRVPSQNSVAARKLNEQLKAGIALARELIPKATASGAGALIDKGAGFFGASTAGADAAAQLDTISGWVTANVPRMEGPQSNADMLLYRQMAADVANRNLPASRRMASLDTLEKLQDKYADINQGATQAPAGGAKPAVAPRNTGLPSGWSVEVN